MSDLRHTGGHIDMRRTFGLNGASSRPTGVEWALPLFLALACTDPQGGVERGAMTISKETQASWVRNFNPLVAPGLSRWPTTCGIYEPLLVFNVVREAYEPWLATSWTWSNDHLTLRFALREGVRWSDGATFDAEDVVFTFDLLREHKALDLKAVAGFVADVRAEGPNTVVFEFQRPFVPGLAFLAQQPIVPEHVFRTVKDPVTYTNPDPVATGPFTEVRVFRDQLFVLGRNRDYWQPGKPQLDALRFPAYPANDQANLALIQGEVDWGGNFVPAIDRIFVERDPEHHHYWFPLVGNMAMLYANTTHPALRHVAVRKALSRGLDRDLIVEVALYGYTKPADATGLSDAYASWKNPAIAASDDWTRHDHAAAAAALDALGYRMGARGLRSTPEGEPFALELDVIMGWSDWIRAAQVVASQLHELGIDVRVQTYDYAAWFDRMQRGDFDLAIGWTVKGPTPYVYYRGLMAGAELRPLGERAQSNWQRFQDERTDELLTEFERTDDRQEQGRLGDELQRRFVMLAPAIPLFPNPPWGTNSTRRVTGFPNAEHPYAMLSPNDYTQPLLVLTQLRPQDVP